MLLTLSGPYSGQIRENTNQKNSVFGHFSRRVIYAKDYSNEHDLTPVNQIEYVTYILGKLDSSKAKLTYTLVNMILLFNTESLCKKNDTDLFIYLFIIYLFKSLFTVSINDSQS